MLICIHKLLLRRELEPAKKPSSISGLILHMIKSTCSKVLAYLQYLHNYKLFDLQATALLVCVWLMMCNIDRLQLQ